MAQRIAKIWIDTDGGVDDALALACAHRDPSVRVAGISTVYGNVVPRKAARNAALVQILAEAETCRVLVGAEAPLAGGWAHARAIHGEDGVGGASTAHRLDYEDRIVSEGGAADVAAAMAEFARRAGGEGAIVCIGPLTNLAAALTSDPEAFARIGGIIVMGGALDVPRVRRGGYEFNFGTDLTAAQKVFELAPRLTVMPLDTCRQVILRRQRLARMVEAVPDRLGQFLRRAHQHYMDAYKAKEGIDGCYPHDALAVATLAEPGLMKFETLALRPEDTKHFKGLLSPAPDARPVRVARLIDQRQALNWLGDCLAGRARA